MSGEKTSPPPFAPQEWGGYGRLRLRPQLMAQMPAVPKIKCIKTGSQSLLSDHHDNRRKAHGDDIFATILPPALRGYTAGLLAFCQLGFLCVSAVVYVLLLLSSSFSPDKSPGSSLS